MDSRRNRICQLSALSENLCQGPGLFCINPGWSFQPKQPLQASLWMQMCACAEQGIKGSISMLVFLQQLVAVSIFSFKSQPTGRVCQSTECRTGRWFALLVRRTQRQAHIKMTGRLMTLCLVSRNPMVRATETRASICHTMLAYSPALMPSDICVTVWDQLCAPALTTGVGEAMLLFLLWSAPLGNFSTVRLSPD